MSISLLLLLLLAVFSQVNSSVTIWYNESSFTMFGLFSTPYANIRNGVKGILYFYNETSCDSPPPFPSDNSSNYSSILLLQDYNGPCTLERVLLARGAGYNAIITYTTNNDNLTITDILRKTGIPIAIIDDNKVDFINKYLIYTNIIVSGSIQYGIIAVSFGFVFFISFCCCIAICSCLFYKLCSEYRDEHDDLQYLLDAERGGPHRNRQDLVESILRHLQEMERDIGAQTPLGPEGINRFPKRKYGNKDELHDTCTICVDEFKEGVTIRELPCQHIFHPDCIDEWLCQHSSLCPLCKINLRNAPSSTLPRLGVMEEEGEVRHTGSTSSSTNSDSEMVPNTTSDYGSVVVR